MVRFVCLVTVGLLHSAQPAFAQPELCGALERAARTIVRGPGGVPAAQVMMDGRRVPPALVPGLFNPWMNETRDGRITYGGQLFVEANARGGMASGRAAYEEWVHRVQACYPGHRPLLRQESTLEEQTLFRAREWWVAVRLGGGGTGAGSTFVDLEVSILRDAPIR